MRRLTVPLVALALGVACNLYEDKLPDDDASLDDDEGTPDGEEICLDGDDNDLDGLVDCEQPSCQGTTDCETWITSALGETCDGTDQTDGTMYYPSGFVDVLACACLDDAGCDDIPTTGAPYLCQLEIDVHGKAACGPPCDDGFDYCPQVGLSCGPTGHCAR